VTLKRCDVQSPLGQTDAVTPVKPANDSKSEDVVPMRFQLGQNYPNPFRDRTTIKYCVGYRCRVLLSVSGIDGSEVERLVDREQEAGTYEVEFSGKAGEAGGFRLEKTYSYRLEAADFRETRQMRRIR
jgi:hypothetical protein